MHDLLIERLEVKQKVFKYVIEYSKGKKNERKKRAWKVWAKRLKKRVFCIKKN